MFWFLSVQKHTLVCTFLLSHTNLISYSNSQSESKWPSKWPLRILAPSYRGRRWCYLSPYAGCEQLQIQTSPLWEVGGQDGVGLRNRGRSVWGEKYTRPLSMEKYRLFKVFFPQSKCMGDHCKVLHNSICCCRLPLKSIISFQQG